jgi:hypothetical protein
VQPGLRLGGAYGWRGAGVSGAWREVFLPKKPDEEMRSKSPLQPKVISKEKERR